jgi:hypothetical protein
MSTTPPREPRALLVIIVLLLTAIGVSLMLSVPPESKVVDLVYGRF